MKHMTIRLAIVALSMPLVAVAVKAQDKALPSFNQDGDRRKSDLKDSVKGDQGEISRLVQTMMATGGDGKYINGHAQAVGLNGPMPIKGALIRIGKEARRCNIVYEPDAAAGNRPVCIYLGKAARAQHTAEERFYRVSLDGQLEKVITLRNKLDDQGKALVEGRSRVEEDMTSPDIKKAFKAEMTFWLKDWLKKQPKLDAKKTTASAATPGKTDTANAAAAPATP